MIRNLLTLLLMCVAGSLSAGQVQEVFKVGIVPQFEARRLHQVWRPILNHIEQQTGYRLELVGSPTIPAFEAEFLEGKFDFAYMNPYHVMLGSDAQGYRPLVRDVGKTLYGVLVTRKGGPIHSVKDLQGKTLAFPAPNALAASLQMRQELVDRFGTDFSARYVKTHDSVYLNVLLGEADAGGGVQKTLASQPPQIRDNLSVIHTTKPVAPHPFSVHPRVPVEQAERVRQAMLQLGKSEAGRALMAKVPISEIGKASMADYEPLRELRLERFYVKSK
ncbi:MAG: phosphate ABC transporter [endosymbiont of Escarpia spicata]|uniref:Phosphate ABC transporter n=1 Tax=endosymbiont of Escarpia spicata TaxID=2200908 RepID=A0A370DME2_9GAMM|nr:MAG: phosphate ABC transporter [endosymbiont of Escarpia spicata]